MKRYIISIMACIVFGVFLGIGNETIANAKDIKFTGLYYKNDGCGIELKQYRYPKGKAKGTFQINIPHAWNAYRGVLIKIGKNKYRSKKKGLIFIVYKKKIKVTVYNKNRYDRDIKGTFKYSKY